MSTDLLDATGSPASAPPGDRPTRRSRLLWVAPIAVAAAVALAFVMRDGESTSSSDQAGYAPEVALTGVQPGAATGFDTGEVATVPAAASPTDAVTRFLDAEIEGDFVASYGLLGADDRAGIGNAPDWAVLHDELPVYLQYAVRSETDGIVVVDVRLEPQLNEVVGAQPAAAQVTFETVRDDGGYRLAFGMTRFDAAYPDRDLARGVALDWVAARQACATSTDGQYEGSLLGELGVAEGLCGVSGQPAAAASGDLDALGDPTFVLSAFGDAAVEWTTVVTVDGLDAVAPLDIVLAPYGDAWLVVGVSAD